MLQEFEINGLVASIWENEFMKEVTAKSRLKTILGKPRKTSGLLESISKKQGLRVRTGLIWLR